MSNCSTRFPRIFYQALLGIFLVGVPLSEGISAKDSKEEKKERQALRRMQQQLSEAQQQKSAVEQEKAGLEDALKKAQGDAESFKRASSSAAAKVSRLEKDVELANKEKADLRVQLAEANKRNEDLLGQQKQLEQDLKKTGGILSKQNERRQLCETHNQELYRLGRELIDWYSGKGSLRAFMEAEPFTQLKSVEMENLLENYRDKLEGERLQGGG